MKAITLLQPWASLMALDKKRFETRSWPTTIRGMVAIHSSKSFNKDCRGICSDHPFNHYVSDWSKLPTSCIVSVGELVKCIGTESLRLFDDLSPEELAFGDYHPGRFVHVYKNLRALAVPIHCKGHLGYWQLPAHLEAEVMRQLSEISKEQAA